MHTPVLASEVVEFLNLKPGATYLDCTLGFGGHARNVKHQNPNIKILGIDQDVDAVKNTKNIEGIEVIRGNFRSLLELVSEKIDGVLFDLGVSSYQIDKPERGFSFRFDASLDMRMDQSSRESGNQSIRADELIEQSSEEELYRIFKEYGEERYSKKIAFWCKKKLPKTTFELKEIVERAIPGWKKRESIARIFQALRIAVNQELDALKEALPQAVELLNPGGRIVVISYHSLEDRIVKWFFRGLKKDGILDIVTKRPVYASEEEKKENPRSKSAKLRVAEKNATTKTT